MSTLGVGSGGVRTTAGLTMGSGGGTALGGGGWGRGVGAGAGAGVGMGTGGGGIATGAASWGALVHSSAANVAAVSLRFQLTPQVSAAISAA